MTKLMKPLLAATAIAAGVYCAGPALATPQEQSMPATQTAQPAQQDLTGQTIYDAKGDKIGTVTAMSTDAQGQPAAVVDVEQFLGMGAKSVLFPVAALQARQKGGYTTTLTSAEIKSLPQAKGSHD